MCTYFIFCIFTRVINSWLINLKIKYKYRNENMAEYVNTFFHPTFVLFYSYMKNTVVYLFPYTVVYLFILPE